MCPLPAYLSKAAGFRMLSEPLILAVGSELYTGLIAGRRNFGAIGFRWSFWGGWMGSNASHW